MTTKCIQSRLISALYLAISTTFSLHVWADSPSQEKNAIAQENEHAAALAYFKGMAEKGDPAGHYYLASMYAEGKGVVRDLKKSAQYFGIAANKGYAPAQYALGESYATGKGGTPKDYAMAAKWFERAAKQGHTEAQYELGRLHHEGLGVRKNQQEAIKWYRKASLQGHPEALKIVAAADTRNEQIAAKAVTVTASETESSTVGKEPSMNISAAATASTPQKAMTAAGAISDDKPEQANAEITDEKAIALIDQALLDAPNTALGINRESWIMSQPSNNYAIQIFFERSEDKVREFMSQLGAAEKSAYFHTRHEGKEYIAVVYGSYPTYSEAKDALETLPDSIKKNLPWIREYNQIKRSVTDSELSKKTTELGMAVSAGN